MKCSYVLCISTFVSLPGCLQRGGVSKEVEQQKRVAICTVQIDPRRCALNHYSLDGSAISAARLVAATTAFIVVPRNAPCREITIERK
jgi:hypothetical protein